MGTIVGAGNLGDYASIIASVRVYLVGCPSYLFIAPCRIAKSCQGDSSEINDGL